MNYRYEMQEQFDRVHSHSSYEISQKRVQMEPQSFPILAWYLVSLAAIFIIFSF